MILENELRRMYWDEYMSQIEIGEVCGVSHRAISYYMKKYRIESRSNSESRLGRLRRQPTNLLKLSKEELCQMYYDDQMTQSEIAEVCGVTQEAISIWMKSYDIQARTRSEVRPVNPSKLSKEELEEMYWIEWMSQKEIANEVGVGWWIISSLMKEYNIDSRTRNDFSGENSNNWHGGISFEPYCDRFNNDFKEAVRERDDYTCQLCGYEQLLGGQKLDVHHIHYDKENCYPDVVALCRSCNARVNSDRDYWEQYFENQLLERGLLGWSISQV